MRSTLLCTVAGAGRAAAGLQLSFDGKRSRLAEALERLFAGEDLSLAAKVMCDRAKPSASLAAVAKRWPDSAWHRRWLIEFVGEEGMDAGGLGKEFFNVVAKELLQAPLFEPPNPDASSGRAAALAYPSPHAADSSSLQLFELAGRFLGKVGDRAPTAR